MNVAQIVGHATSEETMDLLREIIPVLTDEQLYETLLGSLTQDQIEELYLAMEQRKARS